VIIRERERERDRGRGCDEAEMARLTMQVDNRQATKSWHFTLYENMAAVRNMQ